MIQNNTVQKNARDAVRAIIFKTIKFSSEEDKNALLAGMYLNPTALDEFVVAILENRMFIENNKIFQLLQDPKIVGEPKGLVDALLTGIGFRPTNYSIFINNIIKTLKDSRFGVDVEGELNENGRTAEQDSEPVKKARAIVRDIIYERVEYLAHIKGWDEERVEATKNNINTATNNEEIFKKFVIVTLKGETPFLIIPSDKEFLDISIIAKPISDVLKKERFQVKGDQLIRPPKRDALDIALDVLEAAGRGLLSAMQKAVEFGSKIIGSLATLIATPVSSKAAEFSSQPDEAPLDTVAEARSHFGSMAQTFDTLSKHKLAPEEKQKQMEILQAKQQQDPELESQAGPTQGQSQTMENDSSQNKAKQAQAEPETAIPGYPSGPSL